MGLTDSLLSVAPVDLDWRVTTIIALLFPFLLTYFLTTAQYLTATWSKKDGRSPPIVPYSIPLIGNLVPFLMDTERYLTNIVYVNIILMLGSGAMLRGATLSPLKHSEGVIRACD